MSPDIVKALAKNAGLIVVKSNISDLVEPEYRTSDDERSKEGSPSNMYYQRDILILLKRKKPAET
jgi:hypothetical protein